MARVIDAEFIEKYVNREEHNTPDERWRPESEFVALIDNAPTVDAVEVVRCKDCKYRDPENGHCDHYMGTAIPLTRRLVDFCSYGEKMDGGDKA